MRSAIVVLALLFGTAVQSRAAEEYYTNNETVLCVYADNVTVANDPEVSQSSVVLQAMGCLRPGPGIRSRVIQNVSEEGLQLVRLYPAGISGGVLLWSLSSSFKEHGPVREMPTRTRLSHPVRSAVAAR